jgi:NAD-dependent SIR2 family protein deacetylase
LLEQQKKLLRVYTQNIDGLEEVAGVSSKRMVYAHGSLQWATCDRCNRRVAASEIEESIKKGEVPLCQVARSGQGKKPSTLPTRLMERKRPSSKESLCGGVFKPGVTFFGETLHDKVRKSLESDHGKADALIVIGTSLSVAPMSKVIQYLPPSIPRILINRTVVNPPKYRAASLSSDDNNSDDEKEEEDFREDTYTFDAYMLGFCDDVTRAVVKEMKTKSGTNDEGKLLSALEDDEIFSTKDWQSTSIPRDRILLFPGAMHKADDDDDLEYTEVAHCDGCQKEITGTVRKCVQCFDYDLCQRCYPKLLKKHHGGKHSFAAEKC